MMFGLTKVEKRHNSNYVIWANQKTASFVYRQLSANAVLDITCFPAFAVHLEEFYQYGYSAGVVAILAGAGRT